MTLLGTVWAARCRCGLVTERQRRVVCLDEYRKVLENCSKLMEMVQDAWDHCEFRKWDDQQGYDDARKELARIKAEVL